MECWIEAHFQTLAIFNCSMLAVIAPVSAPHATSVLLDFFFLVKSDGLQPEKSNSSETQNGVLVFEYMLTIYYCKHDFRPSGFVCVGGRVLVRIARYFQNNSNSTCTLNLNDKKISQSG